MAPPGHWYCIRADFVKEKTFFIDGGGRLCYQAEICNTGGAMSGLVRFGVSLEKVLLDQFDALLRGKKYTSRSEAIRDLIRQEIVRRKWGEDREVAGAITYIYDHHQRDLLNRVVDLQHDFQKLILSTQHVHLDHDHCLEIVAVKGKASDILHLADQLRAVKGVRHGTLSMSSTE